MLDNGDIPAPVIVTNASIIPPCREILDMTFTARTQEINVWDLVILLPNIVFLLFLLSRVCSACTQLKASRKPILTTFYILIWVVVSVGVVRAIVSLFLRLTVVWEDDIEKGLWLLLRFFLLTAELAVVLFGLGFGNAGIGSKSTIRNILVATSAISLLYSTTQAVLEFIQPDKHYHMAEKNYDLYGNGGMIFLFSTSCLFFVVYSVIIVLPYTRVSTWYQLPAKRGFYVYASILAVLNLVQAVGSMVLQREVPEGLCIVDGTTYLYFTLFAPLVYVTFLRQALRRPSAEMAFSYMPQVDDSIADNGSGRTLTPATTPASRRKKGEYGGDFRGSNLCDTTSTGLDDSTTTTVASINSVYNSGLYDSVGAGSLVHDSLLTGNEGWLSRNSGGRLGRGIKGASDKTALAI